MVDSTQSYERAVQAAAAALAQGTAADIDRAESLYREALAGGERALGPNDLSLVPALTGIGTALVLRGQPDDAGPFFTRAMDISEDQLSEDHPDFVILLNDLSRLYLKQAAFAHADPLLSRLLEIKRRNKGDEHPEVATVMVGLASARQAQGRHDDAEHLFRRVLEIRERTLAPNHLATATALEHLAQTCAARGKLAEALAHSERALTMRESTLGRDHPSLRASRERIADLQLQASDELLESGPAMHERPAAVALPSPSVMSRQPAPKPRHGEHRDAPPAMPRGSAGSNLVVPVSRALATADSAAMQPLPASAYLEALKEIREDVGDAEPAAEPSTRLASFVAYVKLAWTERRPVVFVVLLMLLLPVTALGVFGVRRLTRPQWAAQPGMLADGFSRRDTASASSSAGSVVDVAAVLAGIGVPHKDTTSTARARTSDASATRSSPERREPSPVMQRPQVGRLDSVVRAISLPAQPMTDQFQVQLQNTLAGAQRASTAELQPSEPARRAKLIGQPPAPKYPEQLMKSGIGGEVRVQFDVDTLGRPIPSTFTVLRSPHPLLAESIRRILPAMRFEPARAPGLIPRAITESVEMAFQFAPRVK